VATTTTGANVCRMTFLSSNDTSMLRVRQTDSYGTAMGSPVNGAGWGAGENDITGLAANPSAPATAVAVGPEGSWTTTTSGASWTFHNGSVPDWPIAISWEPGGNVVWVSGYGGHIYKSVDGGASFSAVAGVLFGDHAWSIVSPAANTLYALGFDASDNADLERTLDGGSTWQKLTNYPASAGALGLAASSASTIYVGDVSGVLHTSVNANAGTPTFTTSTICSCQIARMTVAPNGTDIYATGQGATSANYLPDAIYHSGDTGATFARVYESPYTGVGMIAAAANNAIYATGDNGTLLFSSDGTHWSQQAIPTTSSLEAIAASGATAYVGGEGRAVFGTTNTGGTWTSQFGSLGFKENYVNMSMGAPNAVWAVGGAGLIAKTTDLGQTWTPQASGTAQNLRGISAPSTTTVVAVGEGGVITRTTDGTNWATVTSPTGQNLRDVSMADTSYGFAVGDNGTVLRTTNGGAAWTAVNDGTANWLTVKAISSTMVWIGGASGALAKSTDGGTTWTALNGGTTSGIVSVTAADASYAWIMDRNGNDARTTDGGATWTYLTTEGSPTGHLIAIDRNNLWLQGGGDFDSSSDGGTTWVTRFTSGANTHAIAAVDPGSSVGGQEGENGLSWTTANAVPDYGGGDNWAGPGTSSMFGACLQALGGGATASNWTVDANNTCTPVDTDPWNPIPATAVKIAQTSSPGQTGNADIVWGARLKPDQPSGSYAATVTFEVLAPAV
jgi:photosystem II stability/assembly factor-like uncharacterized protein